jgi:hydroxypyruvate reductase
MTTELTGEAREAGRLIAETALEVQRVGQPVRAPACLIAAGETTVTVRGSGRGGRNQEIALSAASVIAGVPGVLLTSFATDGKEGNTDAAGAFVSGSTIAAGRAAGKDERTCLEANDAHSFLEAAGGLIVTGPTGTNVNDITFVLVET